MIMFGHLSFKVNASSNLHYRGADSAATALMVSSVISNLIKKDLQIKSLTEQINKILKDCKNVKIMEEPFGVANSC